MTRSATARRAASGAIVGAVLGASCLAALPAAVGPELQAVVSFDGAPVNASDVHVVRQLPALHMAVVRGRQGALAQLARTPGVRGLDEDNAIRLDSRKEDKHGIKAVLASTGLGGDAGQPGAGTGVKIALIDTGVSDTAALNRASGHLVDAADASDPSQLRTGGVYTDGFGHGTFMASVIAGGPVPGTLGDAIGIAPGATVLNVRVAQQDGTTSLSRVLNGLEWVWDHAADVDVVNLALSHDRPERAYGADPLTDAVEAVRGKGVSVVVSAGNERKTLGDPGFAPRVLTVGALDSDTGRVAPFSGSGNVNGYAKPDVVANGVDILGMLPTGSVIEQSPSTRHLPFGLFRGSGTSQATAVTSGLAAILLAAHPDATPAQVKASLRCAAHDLHGRRDGAGAVDTTTTLCSDADGQALDGSGDLTGEGDFDASSWGASSWGASSWGASSWGASSWGASSWGAQQWAASSWGASSWGASSWGASSWGASSWSDVDWGCDGTCNDTDEDA